jgi:hypothetical protein
VLNVLDGDFWVALNGAFGILMIGCAGLAFTRTSSPRWVPWGALLLAVALFIPFADFIALLVTLLWMLVQSVLMLRRQAVPVSAPAVGIA